MRHLPELVPKYAPDTKFCVECKCHVCSNCDCSVYHLSYQESFWSEESTTENKQSSDKKASKKSKKAKKKQKLKEKRRRQGGRRLP